MKKISNTNNQLFKKISISNTVAFFIVSLFPLSCSAQADGGIINWLSVDTIPEFLTALFKTIAEIGAVVLAFYIVYTGYLFVTAQGNEQGLQKAKESLKWVLIGGAIILGAWVLSEAILQTIQDIGP